MNPARPRTRAAASTAARPEADIPSGSEARAPAREEARPIVPGRAVALNRAGKPIQRVAAETGTNDFFVPPQFPPPGWSWEWKREGVLGQDDPFYMSQLYQVGWENVMYESYPGIFAPEFDDTGSPIKGPVRRKGLCLMERAATLTQEAMADEKRKADEKIGHAKQQYKRLDTRGTTTAEFDDFAARASYIRQQTETVATPSSGRQPID